MNEYQKGRKDILENIEVFIKDERNKYNYDEDPTHILKRLAKLVRKYKQDKHLAMCDKKACEPGCKTKELKK